MFAFIRSTTHIIVGAVTGVGLVENGRKGIDVSVLKNIFRSWVETIPFSGLLSVGIFMLLKNVIA
jgi:phosphate/sulfate permease